VKRERRRWEPQIEKKGRGAGGKLWKATRLISLEKALEISVRDEAGSRPAKNDLKVEIPDVSFNVVVL